MTVHTFPYRPWVSVVEKDWIHFMFFQVICVLVSLPAHPCFWVVFPLIHPPPAFLCFSSKWLRIKRYNGPKLFWDRTQNFFGRKFLWVPCFWTQMIFETQFFHKPKFFHDLIFLNQNFFITQNFSWLKMLSGQKKFDQKKFWVKKILVNWIKVLGQKNFGLRIFFTKIVFW